ncbi:MAG: PfkB family carbohydrate kinase, partial [Candidatus Margulisbacteria bacterium]|nr:PfkB family carbohydrate kinase [Candidatus Margulisiibacteriota bacterium]
VALLGEDDPREDFVSNNLRRNVTKKYFYRANSPTIVKKRYINHYSNQKLFEVNYLNDNYINERQEEKVMKYIKTEAPKYDMVLVSDFGHGFITSRIIKAIQEFSRKYAVNTQTNAANTGYNMITKYKSPFFVCLDEGELRLAAQEKHTDILTIAKKMKRRLKAENMIVTLGKTGSIGIGDNGEINRTPIFSSKVVDTIGTGDAFFAYTAPCFAIGMPLCLVSFIGNVVGALAVQIVGNKKPVEKREVVEFIHNLLR